MPDNPADKETWAHNADLVWRWAFHDMKSWGWPVHLLLIVLVAVPVAGVVGWARQRIADLTRPQT